MMTKRLHTYGEQYRTYQRDMAKSLLECAHSDESGH